MFPERSSSVISRSSRSIRETTASPELWSRTAARATLTCSSACCLRLRSTLKRLRWKSTRTKLSTRTRFPPRSILSGNLSFMRSTTRAMPCSLTAAVILWTSTTSLHLSMPACGNPDFMSKQACIRNWVRATASLPMWCARKVCRLRSSSTMETRKRATELFTVRSWPAAKWKHAKRWSAEAETAMSWSCSSLWAKRRREAWWSSAMSAWRRSMITIRMSSPRALHWINLSLQERLLKNLFPILSTKYRSPSRSIRAQIRSMNSMTTDML